MNIKGYGILFTVICSLLCFKPIENYSVKAGDISKIILIDPGHGGFDGGAEREGVKEKDLNLSISLILAESLRNSGYKVLLTRDKDEAVKLDKTRKTTTKFRDLEDRCKMKEEYNCDMFISIHMNEFPESKYFGPQVWYSAQEHSRFLASTVQRKLKEKAEPRNNRVEKAARNSIKVLRTKDICPSVLIECGFLSNKEEYEKLKSEEYQKKFAEAIRDSIIEFYSIKSSGSLLKR